jgi:hypothetical protein
MIELTAEQAQALEREAGLLKVRDPRTQQVFVLVRQEVYEAMQSFAEPFNRAGWDDPGLDVYEEYRKKP